MLVTEEKVQLLRQVDIFAGIPDEALDEIALLLEEVEAPAGTQIINKGDEGTCMYIVVSGSLRVHDGARVLDQMGGGEVFGEMALFDAAPRSVSITAIEDSRLLSLDQEPFARLIAERAEVASGIVRMLSSRLRARLRDVTSLYDTNEEMERELEIGRKIQAHFLPETLPQPPGWEIAAYFRPARQVGGDFFDAFPVPQREVAAIVIGDVSGKGVGAALFMSLTRSLLRAYAEQQLSPERLSAAYGGITAQAEALEQAVMDIVSDTSNYIAQVHSRAHMFATLFFGALDVSSGLLTYVNAGHEAPVIIGPEGVKARLGTTGPAVGLFPGLPFAVKKVSLASGETLLAFTDGVTDAHDPEGLHLGEEPLISLAETPAPSAASLLTGIEALLASHVKGARQFDDITLLAVRRAVAPGSRQNATRET